MSAKENDHSKTKHYMTPKNAVAFRQGYALAFERLLFTHDLATLLSNFAVTVDSQAVPTDDNWVSEAELFVGKLAVKLDMTDWLQDSSPIVKYSITPRRLPMNMPSLNDAAIAFLDQEQEEAAALAKV